MFKFVEIEFPTSDPTSVPSYPMSVNLHQGRYSHEVAVIKFRDALDDYTAFDSGTPIHLTLFNGMSSAASKDFYGYVHHVKPVRNPIQNYIEVTAISASWAMKNESQAIYKDMSADGIVQSIASKYKFACYTVPHPRIYPQVSQAGISDWGLMVRLARQCGYSLRTENTELYFEPVLHEYTNYRSQAPTFTLNEADTNLGWTIYSFEPLIGDALPLGDESKSAPAISGLDKVAKEPIAHTRPIRNKKTNSTGSIEFFDRYDTHVVANTVDVAQYEAQAAEDRASFAYRAVAEVRGDHTIHPNMPIYIQGVGPLYDTFWVVLKAEHKITEVARFQYTYTTVLTLGTDSLGAPAVWTDNKQITQPAAEPTRTIIPGVAQTAVIPQTILSNANYYNVPQLVGSFGTLKNRVGSATPAPVWVTGTATLNPILTPVGSQAPNLNAKTLLGTVI